MTRLRTSLLASLFGLLALAACAGPRSARGEPGATGPFVSDPSAWGLRSGGVALFVAGSAGYVLQSRCEPGPCEGAGRFGDWEVNAGAPPAGLGSKPSIASWGDGRVDVFVRGKTDGALWHQTWEGSRWLGWENLGGLLAAAPAAVSWGPRRIDVFIHGVAYSSVWHLACVGLTAVPCRGGNWEPWAPSPGSVPVSIVGDLAAGSTGEGHLDIFALGSDSAVWHQNWDGSRWVGWESLTGKLATAPAVAPRGSVLELFATDSSDAVWRLSYSSRGSRDWRKAGVSLQGTLAAAPSDGGVSLFAIPRSGATIVQAECASYGNCNLANSGH